ncbi:hypothetical protein EDE15_4031 [Edaphobacter aggregans]|uniref:Uncharacterized protein n=1 Tax=Edaphobacter aggregans TaxID=570835 RepID=A0A3R9NWH5_9BACT|nr:hypothetical protein EDE15_4031 [Edaphobacter aggregans]
MNGLPNPGFKRDKHLTRKRYARNYRHWAETTCGLEFDPVVSIAIKAQARQNAANGKQAELDEMRKNALDVVEKQPSNASKIKEPMPPIAGESRRTASG